MEFSTFLFRCMSVSVVLYSMLVLEVKGEIFTAFGMGIVGIGSLIGSGMYALQCKVRECCDTQWVKPNMTGLAEVLPKSLHGQHLAIKTIIKSIRGHLNDENPSKALVLSMHGWTGCGKNYVSRFIADHMFHNGYDSKYKHLFVATLHFPHESHINEYKDQLSMWIRGNVSECERSLFIFDEMDKLPSGLIDSIKPFIDHYENLGGTDFRKSVFLFLSNTAGNDITERTRKHWEQGKKREDITLKEMEEVIRNGAFNEKGGLWHADLLRKNLVSAFVPFLPMERTHVKMCIRDDLTRKRHPLREDIIDQVADELTYFPAETKLFSTSGCKRVAEKVNFVMEDY